MTHSMPSEPGFRTTAPRRRRRIVATTGTVAAAVALAVGLTACGSSGNSNSASTPSTTSGASSAHHRHHHGHGVFGTIASENGQTWTVTTRDGSTDTVTITNTTQFGDRNHPETQSQFALGDRVMVRGQASGNTITATRIAKAHNHNGTTPGSTPDTSTPAAPSTN